MAVALTTTFTPPPSCTASIELLRNAEQAIYGVLGGDGTISCLPESFTPTSEFFYTPGLYCPDGYSTACRSSQVVGEETATVVTCCPTGYSCQKNPFYGWESTLGCTKACTAGSSLTIAESGSTRVTTCLKDDGGQNAYSVQLRWRAVDTASPTTSSTPGSRTPGALPSSPPPSNTPLETSPAPATSSNTSLSTGVIAGISVGAILGVTLIGAIIFLAWTIRRSARNKITATLAEAPEYKDEHYIQYQMRADEQLGVVGKSHVPVELDDPRNQRHELAGAS